MRFLYIMVITLVLVGLISWVNYYLLSRLFVFYRGRRVRYLYFLFTVSAILIMYFSRVLSLSFLDRHHVLYYLLVYAALAWLCGQFALIVFQPFLYAAAKLVHQTGETTPAEETRLSGNVMTRRALLRGAATALPLASLGTGMWGIFEAQASMIVRQQNLILPGLSPDLQNFKIGQVSDTHLGPYFSLERLDTVIQLLGQQKPDIVLITGDFADDLSLLAPALERLNSFQPMIPRGIYFCLGNHEYFRNVDLIRTEFAKSRIVLLENENRLIMPGPQPLYLLGVDYPGSATAHADLNISVSRRMECFAAANQNIPSSAFKILMAHHPDFLFDGFAAQIPLTLAGHTHGGQVVIGGRSPLNLSTYMRGLYKENGVYGYVSSGAGHWFPFRMGCPPEVCVFTLQT